VGVIALSADEGACFWERWRAPIPPPFSPLHVFPEKKIPFSSKLAQRMKNGGVKVALLFSRFYMLSADSD